MQNSTILVNFECGPPPVVTDSAGDPQRTGALISVLCVAPISKQGVGYFQRRGHGVVPFWHSSEWFVSFEQTICPCRRTVNMHKNKFFTMKERWTPWLFAPHDSRADSS